VRRGDALRYPALPVPAGFAGPVRHPDPSLRRPCRARGAYRGGPGTTAD